jgi:hypothetical protein
LQIVERAKTAAQQKARELTTSHGDIKGKEIRACVQEIIDGALEELQKALQKDYALTGQFVIEAIVANAASRLNGATRKEMINLMDEVIHPTTGSSDSPIPGSLRV